MSSDAVLVIALVAGLAALALAAYYARVVMAADQGNDRMQELSAAIREGANAFMKREYAWVGVFVVVLAVLISVVLPWGAPWGSIAYIFGAVLSAGSRFRRDAHRHRRQLPYRRGGPARRSEARPAGGLPRRRRDGLLRGRSGPAGSDHRLPAVRQRAQHQRLRPVQHHCRHRPGGIVDRPVRPRGRRHLHQGGRRGRRPGRQGRGGYPRGRSPQPGGDRRQCGRQRR